MTSQEINTAMAIAVNYAEVNALAKQGLAAIFKLLNESHFMTKDKFKTLHDATKALEEIRIQSGVFEAAQSAFQQLNVK